MAKLLCEYKDVLSSGDHEMGLTRVVCHEIQLAAATVPIRQPTCKLGPKRRRRYLLDRDLIKPVHSAWSSPVVLGWKKDGV